MPIILDKLDQMTVPAKVFTPKFFSSKLTGSGKKLGLLNEMQNPIYIKPNMPSSPSSESMSSRKRTYTNGDTTITRIPMALIPSEAEHGMAFTKLPDRSELVKIGDNGRVSSKKEYYIQMEMHSLILEETRTGANGIKKNLIPCYKITFYSIPLSAKTGDKLTRGIDAIVYYTCNPLVWYNNEKSSWNTVTSTFDDKAFTDYISDYSLYDAVVKQAENWQEHADEILDHYFHDISVQTGGSTTRQVIYTINSIENYNIPLDLYKNIYDSIKKHFNTDDARELCKQNLNLLLSDTLNNLENNKPSLTKLTLPDPAPAVPKPFSKEQIAAISSTEPLILVQSGAGCGKSSVIKGRINYMIDCGVTPSDITVLSFTNAAADHITEICPGIHSMTIARMIHNIYSENFPEHELSTVETIINSLDIYFPHNDFAYNFKQKLWLIVKNETSAFTTMNNFVENHYDEVIAMLNTIKQTSLELEIIICYQQIENFKEPANVQSKYLIIDEVQDNSIFEFIYTLKYVDKHRESLFIVGDCSQTLYEFRAANPKAINILEGSGVFAAYQLQTNYRSNQEILDFANITLQNIEANQYANIRLRANNISAKVTEKSFTDKVTFDYQRFMKITDFNDALGPLIAKNIKPYIDTKLAAGEQVAFLAFTRMNIKKVEDALKSLYPDKKIASLIPEKMYNSTIFSSFIKNYWDEVQFIPSKNIMYTIGHAITNRLDNLVYNKDKSLASVQKLLASWYNEQGSLIMSWQQQHLQGTMSLDDLLKNIRENMIQFEIRHNAIKQALLSARNEENKNLDNAKDADFVLSTIHSAKGLEFDNVVIIYRNDNHMSEEAKRMYYVAFTRAMKSEYILAYDTVSQPQIYGDYQGIIKMLHDKENPQTQTVNDQSKADDKADMSKYTAKLKKSATALDKKMKASKTNKASKKNA